MSPRTGAPIRALALATALVLASGAASQTVPEDDPTTTTSAAVTTAAADCGAQTPPKADPGETWACTLTEDFDGEELDRDLWTVQETSVSMYQSGPEACFVDEPENVSVGDGALRLTVRAEDEPVPCPGLLPEDPNRPPTIDETADYTAGSVTTHGQFTQTYGRFEIRARMPDVMMMPGVQFSYWLYPEADTYGTWPASGELDVMEWYSLYWFLGIPYLHYVGDQDDPFRTNTWCLVLTPGEWHRYTVEWTPTSIRISFDDQLCLENTNWTPENGIEMPAPFDHPFNINLTQALGTYTNPHIPGLTPLPATSEVDYVYVWE